MRVLMTATALFCLAAPLAGQIDARMFRFPDVSDTQIAFVYAGDIWVAPKDGGTANRLSSPAGEELFPRFSPDGSQIAFSGNYDGNMDIYVVPASGGQPTRVTHHPMGDRMVDWFPDGEGILYASRMESGQQRFNQLYRVSSAGGLPDKLPVEIGEFGAISPDGRMLTFMMQQRDSRTWKRYRGGTAPEIYQFDLETFASENITNHPANDGHPMWHGDVLYFLSDRGPAERFNIWAREGSGAMRQVTTFEDFDITLPAMGPSEIVFQAGGSLHLMSLETEETREVKVDVVTDLATLKPRVENVGGMISSAAISPTGKRAVFAARGDIFTVPAEHGVIRNLTQTPGTADRLPRWSPDGRWIAYWTDASGEYQLTLAAADGSGSARTLTSLEEGFRYNPVWSPDSNKLAFIDQLGFIRWHDMATGETRIVEEAERWLSHGAAANFPLSWSHDSGWLAYSLPNATVGAAIHLHDVGEGLTHEVTSGYFADTQPAFDPGGDYLYLLTNRELRPVYSDMDGTWVYPNTTQIAAIPLREDVASPLAPRNDEEEVVADEDEDEEDAESEAESDDESDLTIDIEGFERRLVVLPPQAGNYNGLQAAEGKLVYRRLARSGSAGGAPTPVVFWDVEDREEKTVIADANGFTLSADGKKMLVADGGRFGIVSVAPGQEIETPLRTSELEAALAPREEWRQIFMDVWRLQRDYFYDEQMHGVDWEGIRDQYLPLIDDAVTRWDVDFVIDELIGELNASHTYNRGGDSESAPSRPVGLLGVDWSLENGAYRISEIIRGAPWDNEVLSPLDMPGVDVDAGEYVLAVNGIPLDPSKDPWAAFQGLAGKTVTLTVGPDPSRDGSREVLVETLANDTRLRHLAWIEGNRRRVEELSGGRIGYVYVPDTGRNGQTELVRQFSAQFDKESLVIDERFNSGGQIPDRFVELLNRPRLAYWASRSGGEQQWPPVSHHGYQAMLINGWSGSGGDAFPYFFKESDLGPLIGTRTWGGLIGYSGNPGLIDGGSITVPTFRMYGVDGEWFPEGHGVAPDIEVPEDPTELAFGRDPQLQRAVEELMRMMEENPIVVPDRPEPEDRSRKKKKKVTTDGAGGGL